MFELTDLHLLGFSLALALQNVFTILRAFWFIVIDRTALLYLSVIRLRGSKVDCAVSCCCRLRYLPCACAPWRPQATGAKRLHLRQAGHPRSQPAEVPAQSSQCGWGTAAQISDHCKLQCVSLTSHSYSHVNRGASHPAGSGILAQRTFTGALDYFLRIRYIYCVFPLIYICQSDVQNECLLLWVCEVVSCYIYCVFPLIYICQSDVQNECLLLWVCEVVSCFVGGEGGGSSLGMSICMHPALKVTVSRFGLVFHMNLSYMKWIFDLMWVTWIFNVGCVRQTVSQILSYLPCL